LIWQELFREGFSTPAISGIEVALMKSLESTLTGFKCTEQRFALTMLTIASLISVKFQTPYPTHLADAITLSLKYKTTIDGQHYAFLS